MSAAAARVLARAACVWGLTAAAHAASSRGTCRAPPVGAFAPPPRLRACATRASTRRVESSSSSSSPSSAARSFDVHAVAGDGRCLFRSVAASRALRDHGARPDPASETLEADRLRRLAVDELARRRADVEWFIEGDFDAYCDDMRRPGAWGGEPEILMLARALGEAVEVFMPVADGGVRSIAVYGEDDEGGEGDDEEGDDVEKCDASDARVAVLFHGAGHYEALAECDDARVARE